MNIIKAVDFNFADPHGYCRLDFTVPHKRKRLGDQIRELHIFKKSRVIPPSTSGYFEKKFICNFLDKILHAQKPHRCSAVKRKLFFPNRSVPRKKPINRKSKKTPSILFYFKRSENVPVHKKIKKNYLNDAQIIVLDQIVSEYENKRKLPSTSQNYSGTIKKYKTSNENNPEDDKVITVETESGAISIETSKLTEICKYHDNMARQHISKPRTEDEQQKRDSNTEACRLSRRVSKLAGLIIEKQYQERTETSNKIVEESIRSIHYLKTLLDMLMDMR